MNDLCLYNDFHVVEFTSPSKIDHYLKSKSTGRRFHPNTGLLSSTQPRFQKNTTNPHTDIMIL